MSHQLLAELWRHLEKRTDIGNILRELIGQHALESPVSDNTASNPSTFRLVVSLKLLFDLQRIYMQSLNLSSQAYLLQVPQVFHALLYLLQIQPPTLSHEGRKEELSYVGRSFILQTVLSGFRLLSLRSLVEFRRGNLQPILPPENLKRLKRACKNWDDGGRTDLDRFVIDEICKAILDEIGANLVQKYDSPIPRNEIALPDYSHNLYPVESKVGDILPHVQTAVSALHEQSTNWLGYYMLLYDLIWSASAASIQLYSDQEKERKVSIRLDDLQRRSGDLRTLRAFRENIYETLYRVQESRGVGWYNTVMESIVDGLLPLCFQTECGCFKEVFVLSDERTDFANFGSLESVKRSITIAPLLEDALRSFLSFLIDREDSLTDCNGDFKSLSEAFSEGVKSWSNPGYPSTSETVASSLDNAVYVLPCRMAHPISSHNLKILIENTSEKTGLKALEQNKDQFEVDIVCKLCNPEFPVASVRQIVPLTLLSSRLKELAFRRSHWNEEQSSPDIKSLQSPKIESVVRHTSTARALTLRPQNTQMGARRQSVGSPMSVVKSLSRMQSHASSSSIASIPIMTPLTHLSTTPSTERLEEIEELTPSRQRLVINDESSNKSVRRRSGLLPGFVRSILPLSPQRSPSPVFVKPSYTFSADGNRVLWWNPYRIGYGAVESASVVSCEMPGVELAAGGAKKIGVVLLEGGVRFLRIYNRLGGLSAAREFPLYGNVESMALSPDDKFVAVTQGRDMTVYDLERTGVSYKHILPKFKADCVFDSQKLSFGPHGKFIIASTRDRHILKDIAPDNTPTSTVHTYIANCTTPNRYHHFKTNMKASAYPDHGITCSIYNPTTSLILITFFAAHVPPHLISLSPPKTRTVEKPVALGTRIQCGAITPSGDDLVLLNAKNEVFWVRKPAEGRQVEACTTLSRAPVGKKSDLAVVSSAVVVDPSSARRHAGSGAGVAHEDMDRKGCSGNNNTPGGGGGGGGGTVRFFWVEAGRGILTKVDRKGVKETVVFGSLL